MGDVNAASWSAAVHAAQQVAEPFQAVVRLLTQVASDVYRDVVSESPYRKLYVDQGFKPCPSTHPLLCFARTTPAKAKSFDEVGIAPAGETKFALVPATPEVNERVAINVISGAIAMTRCVAGVCDTTRVQQPKPAAPVQEAKIDWDILIHREKPMP